MKSKRILRPQSRWLAVEALAFGLAGGAGLCWVSVCLLASFRPGKLSSPYWSGLPDLRSDTSGILAFFALGIFLAWSEFLRLRRQQAGVATYSAASVSSASVVALAVCETIALLATGLVFYFSVNAVTHPVTLEMQATHLMSWPTEGTLRVVALLLCVCSLSTLRFVRARCTTVPGNQPNEAPSWRDGTCTTRDSGSSQTGRRS